MILPKHCLFFFYGMLFFSLFLFLPSSISADIFNDDTEKSVGNGVEVQLTSKAVVDTDPGRIVTASFLVSNKAAVQENYIEAIDLPPDWQIIVPRIIPFSLLPNEQKVRFLTFLVPAKAADEKYRIIYSVKSNRDSSLTGSKSFTVQVSPLTKVDMLVENTPETVTGGNTFGMRVRLLNNGNAKVEIAISIKSDQDCRITYDQSEITLMPGESQGVDVKIRTNGLIRQNIRQTLNIEALVKKNGKNQGNVKKSVTVQIIPKISSEMDPYLRLPTQMKIIFGREKGNDGLQAEYSGYGSLDENRKRKISFLFRGPDIQEITPYGKIDEYRLNYTDEKLNIQLGDDSYSLSKLTQMYTYGRGASVTAVPGKFGLSSFYVQNKWGSSKEMQWGSNVMYRLHDNVTMKSNFFYKPHYSGYDTKKIASLEMQYRFMQNNTIEAEYGVNTEEGIGNNTAFLVDLNGKYLNRISYNFRRIFAKPKFYGYYNDMDYTSGSVVSPLFRRLTWDLNFNANSTNLALDRIKQFADTNGLFRTGIRYPFPFGTNLSLHYEKYQKEDRFLPAAYDYNENTFIIGAGHSLQNINLNVEIEKGKLNDNLSGANKNLERYRLNAYFRPNSWQTYSLSSTIGHDKYTEKPNRARNIGFSSFWRLINKEISLNYSKNTYMSYWSRETDTILSTFSYKLRNSHSITFQTYLSKNSDLHHWGYSYYFIYTLPLNLPIGLKKDVGTMKGMIHYKENGQERAMPNALLSVNGLSTVTDSQGRFNFGLVKAGAYQLQIDEKSIGLDKMPTTKNPLLVEIKGGETNEIVIVVVTSCKIRGKVVLFGIDQSKRANILDKAVDYDIDSLEEKEGLGNILVEVKNENEIVRDVTDKKGMFSFDKLKPGTWTLKVMSDNLPDNHYIQDDTRSFELKQGETKEIIVKVLPLQRKIRFIDQGTLK